MEKNVRLFYHITRPRKLPVDLMLLKQVAIQSSKSVILENIFFSMFKHILNFQHELKPYCCQLDNGMSPDAFLNEGFISANFVIINTFPKMGHISCWSVSRSLLSPNYKATSL